MNMLKKNSNRGNNMTGFIGFELDRINPGGISCTFHPSTMVPTYRAGKAGRISQIFFKFPDETEKE